MKLIQGEGRKLYSYFGTIVIKGYEFETSPNFWMCYDLNGSPIPCWGHHLEEYK